MMRPLVFALFTAFLFASQGAQAHKPSDSYLTLDVDGTTITGQWDIALRDIEHAIGLDGDGDGAITWGELRSRHDEVAAYALAHLRLGPRDAPCALSVTDHEVARHSDGAYAVLAFRAACSRASETLEVAYSLLFDLDPQHRGLLQIGAGETTQTAVLSPAQPARSFALSQPSLLNQVLDYLREGVWHIWIGYDHILFLITLLLPAVVVRSAGSWWPVEGFRAAFLSVAKIVTAFTLAHSVTLSLAVLEVVVLPSRLVESVIAASVAAAALNNIWPVVTRRLWLMAFAFGLVHGFGFAGVLADLGLPGATLLWALAGFNLGVEAGQLAIVAAVLPLTYWLRHSVFYGRLALPVGSGVIAAVGGLWLLERMLELELPLV